MPNILKALPDFNHDGDWLRQQVQENPEFAKGYALGVFDHFATDRLNNPEYKDDPRYRSDIVVVVNDVLGLYPAPPLRLPVSAP